ncbi:tRNA-specific adenosine deaminase [Colletotrichum camelliae]|nr:tRNA-specific adenosine deaminase [Colletotrichum camelliae]
MGNMKKAPSTTKSTPDDSESEEKRMQRFSTTGKFLQTVFARLKSPFSPNTKSPPTLPLTAPSPSPSPPSAPAASSQSQSSLAGEQDLPPSLEQPKMADVTPRTTISHIRDSAGNPQSPKTMTALALACDKEDQVPSAAVVAPTAALTRLSVDDAASRPRSSGSINRDPYTPTGEKRIHQVFMDQALDMARLALRTNETPVGCVLVHKGAVVARGMNATNVTRNGTRHAEFMALSALLSYGAGKSEKLADDQLEVHADQRSKSDTQDDDDSDLFPMDDDYVRNGHLYPYGQKLHRDPQVARPIVRECILYVTVEPCVMCAGLLRQLGIKKVYFGAVNDKFGGTGGVFSIHKNSADSSSSAPATKPLQVSTNASNMSRPSSSSSNKGMMMGNRQVTDQPGDGGNVERGFEAEGGWGRDEAVSLLRRFYVQENGRAPVPRKKEGRAARLAAMEQAGSEAGTTAPAVSTDAEAASPHDTQDGPAAGTIATLGNIEDVST